MVLTPVVGVQVAPAFSSTKRGSPNGDGGYYTNTTLYPRPFGLLLLRSDSTGLFFWQRGCGVGLKQLCLPHIKIYIFFLKGKAVLILKHIKKYDKIKIIGDTPSSDYSLSVLCCTSLWFLLHIFTQLRPFSTVHLVLYYGFYPHNIGLLALSH